MASIIRIKRSSTAGNPATLGAGELAYSALNGAGGNRLYIGMGTETSGNAANHFVIGGTYYTGLIDASTAGTLTTNASSIPVLSSTGTIDTWKVGNTQLTGNTLSTTNNNGNLILNPNGTGMVQIAGTWTLPRDAGTNGYVLTQKHLKILINLVTLQQQQLPQPRLVAQFLGTLKLRQQQLLLR
jgi:hypothetical protein